jgi:hypothetical protein
MYVISCLAMIWIKIVSTIVVKPTVEVCEAAEFIIAARAFEACCGGTFIERTFSDCPAVK